MSWYLGQNAEPSSSELIDPEAAAKAEAVETPVEPEGEKASLCPPGFDMGVLPAKLAGGPDTGVALFGSVPPRASVTDPAKISAQAARFTSEICQLPGMDGVIVYDIQDEEGRDPSIERPYKFAHTISPARWAQELLKAGGVETIVYHGIANEEPSQLATWVDGVTETSRAVVFVGASSSKDEITMTVPQAGAQVRSHAPHVVQGGIWLPERHRDKGDEHERMAAKVRGGLTFFTSQVIFNADVAIWALRDYDEHCRRLGHEEKPGRLIFTFAPFGRADTAVFLRWLGVEIPIGTEKRILSRTTKAEALVECVELCRENFKRILYAVEFYNVLVPIGVSVESVSKYRDEYSASLELFKVLRTELDAFLGRRRQKTLQEKWWPSQ